MPDCRCRRKICARTSLAINTILAMPAWAVQTQGVEGQRLQHALPCLPLCLLPLFLRELMMRWLTWTCAGAIFLGSCLLFFVEPMAAKQLLPLLGGSAAVWTTCLVFFQATLLLGYLCAHWIATRLRPRSQALAYGFLLIASLAQIALNLNPHPHASTARPIVSVLVVLSGLIGID